MSKKKKIIAIVAILLAILVSFLGGQTFSKYITEVIGKANAKIAHWQFKVNGQEALEQEIELGSTRNDKYVADNKIAPGTNGKFIISVDGSGSDVGVQYELGIKNETAKPHNLYFIYKGQKYENLAEITNIAGGVIEADAETKVKEVEIAWEWPYEIGGTDEEIAKNNKLDTDDSLIGNYKFDMIVIGTQIMPDAEI